VINTLFANVSRNTPFCNFNKEPLFVDTLALSRFSNIENSSWTSLSPIISTSTGSSTESNNEDTDNYTLEIQQEPAEAAHFEKPRISLPENRYITGYNTGRSSFYGAKVERRTRFTCDYCSAKLVSLKDLTNHKTAVHLSEYPEYFIIIPFTGVKMSIVKNIY
jgi:hypothetical protein